MSSRVASSAPTSHERWGPFTVLAGVIALRSFVYFGLITFIPLYFVHVLATGKALGNAALSAMLVGGAFGTLIGGPLADRFGRRGGPDRLDGAAAAADRRRSWSPGRGWRSRSSPLAGAATIATFAVTIVMGQEYLPGRLGVSSGVTIGLSIGLGGVGAPLLGLLADADGLRSVFELIAVLPLAALVLTLFCPAAGRCLGALRIRRERSERRV